MTAGATITATSVSFTPTSDLADGDHTAEPQVADLAGNPQFDQTTFTIQPASAPPALDPIGNQTVSLGSSLTLNLTATDPNNYPLTFSATPLPLPDNASLHAMTGVFTFAPAADQVGDIVLTCTVSDGLLTDSETSGR